MFKCWLIPIFMYQIDSAIATYPSIQYFQETYVIYLALSIKYLIYRKVENRYASILLNYTPFKLQWPGGKFGMW